MYIPKDLLIILIVLLISETIITSCLLLAWYRSKASQRVLETQKLVHAKVSKLEKKQQLSKLMADVFLPNSLSELYQRLLHIYGSSTTVLQEKYPQLTELDICVLIMIGAGVSNIEIIQYFNMTKRTYYKRRQVISKRLGISATELESFSKKEIALSSKTNW